jgi:hypothetical protein
MADDRYNVDEAIVFTYAVRNFRTGQTVTIDIYNDAGVSQVSSGSMTEIGSTGIYQYSWTPDTLDHYVAIMDCSAFARKAYQKFQVIGYVPGTPTTGNYCTTDDVRNMTNIDTGDLTNSEITALISSCIKQVNKDLNTVVTRESIDYIDSTRENDIDGSNTTYYVKNWKGKYIGDKDDDGDVDTSDITVYQVTSDGTETTLNVSTITPNSGYFVLSSAPSSGVNLYVDYEWAYVSESTPDPLVVLATTLLASSYAYAKLNIGRAVSASFGDTRFLRHMESWKEYYDRYRTIVNQINERGMIQYGEADVI